jgi:hypothetical protein
MFKSKGEREGKIDEERITTIARFCQCSTFSFSRSFVEREKEEEEEEEEEANDLLFDVGARDLYVLRN